MRIRAPRRPLLWGLAGATGTKGSMDSKVADDLLSKIAEIDKIFWETKQA